MTPIPHSAFRAPHSVELVVVHDPFRARESRERLTLPYRHGARVPDYLQGIAPPAEEYAVSLNGGLLPFSAVSLCTPLPGDQLVVAPVLADGGDGGGKDIFRMVAMVAVMIVATVVTAGALGPAGLGLLGPSFAAGGWGAIGAGLAISVGGALLVNALVPNRPPELPDISGLGTTSQTYGWDGMKMLASQGSPIPPNYGTHKRTGVIIQRSVTTIENKQYLNLLIALGEGPVESLTDVEINGNPASYYQGIEVETRLGTLNQTPISYFHDVSTESGVGALVTQAGIQSSTQGDGVQALEVELLFPYGIYDLVRDQIGPTEVAYALEYKPTAGGNWTHFPGSPFTQTNDQRSALRFVHRVDDLAPDAYTVRATRITDPDTGYKQTACYWQVLREIVYDDIAYVGTVLLGIRVLATDQLSGSEPTVTCIVTRGDVQVWDGNQWLDKPSDNPAWAAFDALVNPRYGGGVSGDRVDYPSFLVWAGWCNDPVDDGDGGEEARARFDGPFDSEQALWEALVAIATTARGAIVQQATTYKAFVDAPATPAQLFSVANIVEGSFKETYLAMQDRATEVEVTYLDRDRGYERNVLSVLTEEGFSGTAVTRKNSVPLLGVVRASQAYREGRWRLLMNTYLTRMVEWDVSVDSIACEVGDVVYLQHDAPQWGRGGRVVACPDASHVQLDMEVTLEEGKTYRLLVRLANDTLVEKAVVVPEGGATTDIIEVSVPFAVPPALYDVFIFGEVGLDRQPFRLLKIRRAHELNFTLTGVEYNEAVYDDDVPIIPAPPTTRPSLPGDVPPPVMHLSLVERWPLDRDGTVHPVIDVLWEGPSRAAGAAFQSDALQEGIAQDAGGPTYPYLTYRLYVSGNGGATWEEAGSTNGFSFTIVRNILEGRTYVVAVVSESPAGQRLPVNQSSRATIAITGKSTAPDPPTDVQIIEGFQLLSISWTPAEEEDLDVVEVWRSLENDSDTAEKIGEARGIVFNDSPLANGTTYYYWLASRNTSGQVSVFHAGKTAGASGTTVSVQTADFATSIEPVTIVSSVPETKVTNAIFNTADRKLYRWNGSAYVATVPGADIVADSITAGQIAAGAIGASEIAAHAIDSDHLRTDVAVISVAAQIANAVIGSAHITDLAVDNAKIANLTLATGKIQDNAISAAGAFHNAGSIAISTLYYSSIAEIAITPVNGTVIIIAKTNTQQNTLLKIYRSGDWAELDYARAGVGNLDVTSTLIGYDTSPGTSARTYYLMARAENADGTATNRAIFVLNLKK